MIAMTSTADSPPARLAATRDGLHRVAEHILAASLYAASGEIGLVPSPGGFRTPPFGADGRFLAVDGTELVAGGPAGSRRATLPPPGDPAFWNASFGAARTWRQCGTVAEAQVSTQVRRTS